MAYINLTKKGKSEMTKSDTLTGHLLERKCLRLMPIKAFMARKWDCALHGVE